MSALSEKSLRRVIRGILRENVYDRGRFSAEKVKKSISSYTLGDLALRGVSPEIAKEMTLDDLRIAFGEMGFDMYASLQRAVDDDDREAVEDEVREILANQFIQSLESIRSMGVKRLEDILLPGDVDELVQLIADDMQDGDGVVTLN